MMYKWPQDLLCHLKTHLLTRHSCPHCEYSNPKKRLLVQHIRVHSNYLPFACRQCGTQFKHSMQCYHHEKSLNHFATIKHVIICLVLLKRIIKPSLCIRNGITTFNAMTMLQLYVIIERDKAQRVILVC